MALQQLVNDSNAAALVTASGDGEYLLSLLGFWLVFREACTLSDDDAQIDLRELA
ncbi:hypothetical protein [Streptomyces sp. NPDC002516]